VAADAVGVEREERPVAGQRRDSMTARSVEFDAHHVWRRDPGHNGWLRSESIRDAWLLDEHRGGARGANVAGGIRFADAKSDRHGCDAQVSRVSAGSSQDRKSKPWRAWAAHAGCLEFERPASLDACRARRDRPPDDKDVRSGLCLTVCAGAAV